ncbi:MAG: (E)-4-hydroxy-3-methylbut-2-enyl-diphosphate synthase [Bacteroidaceae bacterium]|nr:(E)-4-hydroxy-3-methylbut-2-enyl-diphosphate synthase [Bacteroidaceae bacterium]MBR6198437.1 (E)-4-hydroxy-3-methylbut-2-enyl-diphosphate synthase [Bacteroidaceae bacterium]
MDLFNYSRRWSSEVNVGGVLMGSVWPIRVQSMANTSTMDTEGSVAQAKRIVDAGGEIVRFTTQGKREALNMKNINAGLRQQGYNVPLVADVHFNAAVADVAATICEKVRINPGNYVDPARTFKSLEYTDEEYAAEIKKIEDKFVPFLNICKEHHTAIRIGVNHGSLSDRIMSRYGDTPEGMVESCMEFLRICVREQFKDVVISIKASNTVVMVRTVRLLVTTMDKEGMAFPLHLGVTEAGDGEDGRIKSAVGIGALLSDGIGDTVRVSLSEAPENEIPVARKLVDYAINSRKDAELPIEEFILPDEYKWLRPEKRKTVPVTIPGLKEANGEEVKAIGGDNVAVVLNEVPIRNTVVLNPYRLNAENVKFLKNHPEVLIVSLPQSPNKLGEHRALAFQLMNLGVKNPMLICQTYQEDNIEDLQLKSALDSGVLFIDGLADGIILLNASSMIPQQQITDTAYGILQASRTRFTKTEYISCPGCGRTLYNLEETIKKIKAATSHLKGLKIGIMGCIVNGPGEMADADYGYVGAGVGKVSLYKKKECIEKNIPEAEAVERLIKFIEQDQKGA